MVDLGNIFYKHIIIRFEPRYFECITTKCFKEVTPNNFYIIKYRLLVALINNNMVL